MPPPEATLIQRSHPNDGPVRRSPSHVTCAVTSHRDGAAGSSVIADVGSWAAAIDAVRHATSVVATTRVIDPPCQEGAGLGEISSCHGYRTFLDASVSIEARHAKVELECPRENRP